MKLKDLVFTALFAAIICVLAPFVIPVGPIPLSLATFAIYIAASVIDWKYGTLAVIVYILIGTAGLPVFSGFSGGVMKIAGPTGGYIVGYIVCALVIGLIVDRNEKKKWVYPVAMIVGTALLYACGTARFINLTGTTLTGALTVCVIPFLIGDAIKIILASVIAPKLRTMLKGLRR